MKKQMVKVKFVKDTPMEKKGGDIDLHKGGFS